jgi:hypothetical protein
MMAKLTARSQLLQMQQAKRYHDWKGMTRDSKRAAILWPGNTSKETRVAMAELTDVGKRPPRASPLLSDQQRSYVSQLGGQAKRSR